MIERTQLSKASEWFRSAVANNPEGLLLLAAGSVLLMRRSGAGGGSLGVPKGAEARSARDADSLLDQAGSVTESIASSASDYARSVRRAAGDGSARIMRQAQSTFDSGLERALRDQPLLVALGGIAAGAAIAAVLPPSNLEQQALAPLGEQISEEASRVGDQLRKTASKAADTLRTAVQENSLDPDGLKKTVSEVTEVVREGIKGEPQGQPRSSLGQSDWRQGR
jgi:hypothetical protein